MYELIKIEDTAIGDESVPTVNARELHEFLESKQKFSDWIKKRIEKLRLLENKDFCTASQTYETANGGYSSKIANSSIGAPMWTIINNGSLPLLEEESPPSEGSIRLDRGTSPLSYAVLEEAYQHSYVVCDTTLPLPSLLAESYVLGSFEEQALVHIRPENLLQAINVAIYTRKIPARSFLSLFETTFSIMAYEALKRGWNSFFFDVPSLVTARLAQKLSEGAVSFSKVYDGYYVCSGSLPASLLEQRAIKKEEHSIEYNPTNGELSFSYFSTIDPLDLVKRLLKEIEKRQYLSIEFIAREEEVAEYAYSLGFNVLKVGNVWLCTFR